jgi:signal transduction histidine kinase
VQLARELHDVVAHHVTGIVVQAQAAQLVAARRPETLPASLAAIEAAGAEALAAMRRMIGVLRDGDDVAGRAPRAERLDELVARFAGQHPSTEVSLAAASDEEAWPDETAATVQRIVQEALTNVARHAAGAHEICVTVGEESGSVTVEVTDDAPAGVAVPGLGGYGLVGMRERVEALGGTLDAGARAAGGWRVRATLPLPAAGGGAA